MDTKMEVSDKMNCVACLKSKRTVKKITDEQLLQCYNSILEEIPVSIPNSQPNMCSKCTDLLKKCSAFKQKIKESYKRLQTYSDEKLQKFLPEIHTEMKSRGPLAKPEAIDIVDDMFVKEEVKVEFDNDLQKTETEIDALGDSPDISHSDISEDDNENTKDDVVKKIKVKKSKRCPKNSLTKKEQKIMNTIELSYEEMLQDRQREAAKECFVNAKYRCDSCYLVFAYQKSLDVHMKAKHDPTIGDYSCPVCNVVIPSVEAFTAHYKRHMRRYECTVCQQRAGDMKAVQRHYYSAHAHAGRDYTCGVCGTVSKTMDAHRYHKDTHKHGRVQCSSCDKTFRHRNGLANHRMTVHESSGKIICAHCGKEFRWKTSLKRHEDRHHGTKQQSAAAVPSCQSCDITFASMSSYLRHMKNSLKHVSKDQLRYICDECGRRYANKTKLRDHIEEKHLHRKFSCHICNKPSKNRVALDQHIRNVHKGRPNNKMCHQCGKGFPTKVQLESHLRAHTGERPFICEHCPTTFSQHSNLYKHTRQVHMNIKKQLPKKPGETRTHDPGKPEASTSVLEATVMLTHPGFVI